MKAKWILIMAILLFIIGCGKEKRKIVHDTVEGNHIKVFLWEPLGKPQGFEKVKKKLKNYVADKYNYDVDVEFIYDMDYEGKMNTKILSGEDWDVMLTSNANGSNPYGKLAKQGSFLDLTPYLKTTLKDTVDYLGDTIIKATSYQGIPYGIKTSTKTEFGTVISHDNNILKKVGIDPIDSNKRFDNIWELEPYLKKVVEYNKTHPNDQIIPLHGPDRLTSGYGKYDLVLGLPESLVGIPFEGGPAVSFYETSDFLELTKNLRNFYSKGYMIYDRNNPFSMVRSQFAFMTGNGTLDSESARRQYSNMSKKDMGVNFLKVAGTVSTASANDIVFEVNSQTEAPKTTTHFINLLFTDTYIANLLEYGIQGEEWEFVDKEKKIIKKLGNEEYVGNYWISTGGNSKTLYTLEGHEGEANFGKMTELKKESPVAESIGFFFDATPVQNEVAALTTIVGKYNHVRIGLPKNWDVDYKNMVEELHDAGLDKVVVEVNKQLDDWRIKRNKKIKRL